LAWRWERGWKRGLEWEWLSEQESALALVKERASLLAKLSVSAWVSAKELVSRLDSDSELE
jgi:hypothetical protein